MVKKSISVESHLYALLKQWKTEMKQKLGGNITFSMVVQSLVNDRTDLQNTKTELVAIQKEAEETQTFIKQILLKSVERSTAPTQTITYVPSIAPNLPPPPPSPQQILPNTPPKPQEKKSYQPPKETANLKKDYHDEVKAVFTGEILKPSEILQLTQPKHKNATDGALSEEEIKKRKPQTMYAEEHAEKFKTEKHDFVTIIPEKKLKDQPKNMENFDHNV